MIRLISLSLLGFWVSLQGCSGKQGFDSQTKSDPGRSAEPTVQDQKVAPDPQADEEEKLKVNEPVAVGGAFLTCNYPAEQDQADARTLLACQLQDLPESLEIETVTAQFEKTDTQGQVHPLSILRHNRQDMSWLLVETRQTAYLERLRAHITINDSEPFQFDFNTAGVYSIAPNTTFWLAGEPNNEQSSSGNIENCTELRGLDLRNAHIEATGMDNGPLAALNDAPCDFPMNFLCRYTGDEPNVVEWLLSDRAAPFNEYATACPEGYIFGFPRGEVEMTAAIDLVDQNPDVRRTWVGLHDQNTEGLFEVILR